MKIAIVGLGYVGLPLAIQFASSNVNVLGLDVDKTKVDLINNGQSYIKHIAAETIAEAGKMKRLCASTDFSRVKEVEAVIICVPTPLSREPRAGYLVYSRDRQGDRVAFGQEGHWSCWNRRLIRERPTKICALSWRKVRT